MLSTISSILNSTIVSKLGDWAFEVYKIVAGKKDKDRENSPTTVVVGPIIVINSPPSASTKESPMPKKSINPSSGLVLPLPPTDIRSSGEEPSSSLVLLPLTSAEEGAEPEFGSDEDEAELLKTVYKNIRSNDGFRIGLGNTDVLSNKGKEK